MTADGTFLVQSRLEITQPNATRPTATHLLSFRSCSENPKKKCNKPLFDELRDLSKKAGRVPSIQHHHFYYGLPPEILQDPRWKRHVAEGTRGRGYWFWKPALVNFLLSTGKLQVGDTVVYADADFTSEFKGRHRAQRWSGRWSAFLANNAWDIFAKFQPSCEALWTKGDIFEHFGVEWSDPHYGLTAQAFAQFWIVQLNQRTIQFMRHWEDLASNFTLISDEASNTQNSPFFIENRHDQSLMSMLLKASLVRARVEPCAKLKMSNSTVGYDQGGLVLHARYGIPNLTATIGDFAEEAAKAEAAQARKGVAADERLEMAKTRRPVREICVRGVCHDLNALPANATPDDVE